MTRLTRSLTIGATLLAAATLASAEDIYIGASAVRATYSEDGVDDVNPTIAAVRLGRQTSQNLAFEARLGVGVDKDTVNVAGIPVEVEIDNFFGVYARGILPVSPMFSLYGLLGYTQGKVSASAFGLSASQTDGDISYGVGADISASKNTAITLEWARLFEGTGYDVSGLSVGVKYRF